ncbi:MAG: glycerate kinase [Oscillospiraceae bacterium]|nr:glycerate kinase [Oscillospiraceae bacterium]
MKTVIAIDSFKGCMSSLEAGNAAKRGLLSVCDSDIEVFPIADGGEGTCDVLTVGLEGNFKETQVHDPIGRMISARYGVVPKKKLAIIEMAASSGLTLVEEELRDPINSNTYGVGELILDALHNGCREFIIGIGGSATTEAGIGMLHALGFRFLDADEKELAPYLLNMSHIHRITDELVSEELNHCAFHIACDVVNPLCGENGAVRVYGRQKGVLPEQMEKLDQLLDQFSRVSEEWSGRKVKDLQGAGASGGLGFAFLNFFRNVDLRPGLEVISDSTGLRDALASADYVITGEGKIDSQTKMGKVPYRIAKMAYKPDTKTIAFCGAVEPEVSEELYPVIDDCIAITPDNVPLALAMQKQVAIENMEKTVANYFKAI